MTASTVFMIANSAAPIAWLLLMIFPRREGVLRLAGLIVPAIFAVAYVIIIAATFGRGEGGFSSLEAVAALFANPWMLLAGWLHYLAFDLLIGVWETRDAMERGVPRVLLIPCLIMTFMFGPAGWLLYIGLRRVGKKPGGAAGLSGKNKGPARFERALELPE